MEKKRRRAKSEGRSKRLSGRMGERESGRKRFCFSRPLAPSPPRSLNSALRPLPFALRIGVDIGGTFTDLVLIDDSSSLRPPPSALRLPLVHKVLSTPKDSAQAVLLGIAEVLEIGGYPINSEVDVVHGTTVATNALLERKGARLALITTEGFEDIIEIGRQNRPELYNFYVQKPEPLVPSKLRFGIPERTLYTGEILQKVNKKDIVGARRRLAQLGVESIAICFLFSYANPANEVTVYQMLQDMDLPNSKSQIPNPKSRYPIPNSSIPNSEPRIPISASHLIVPEYREYERFSTTVVNAYITPVMQGYINRLEKQVNGSLRIMQSNGGSISAKTASEQPVRTILSGPAGGVVGAFEMARLAALEKIITFDMGGTSTDVCLCDGEIKITTEGEVGGCPIKVPLIDIHTVGAGGGSIAYIDEGGALRVGPQSAGADPGPICYGKAELKDRVGEGEKGRGGEKEKDKDSVETLLAAPNSEGGNRLTVTDANVFLGRMLPDHFLGGKMKLEVRGVRTAMAAFAKRLGYTPQQAAEGIIKVVNATMERAIRVISIERGYDTQEFVLVSFGGAGGLHACELASALSIPVVLVPKNPGALSAFGMLISDVIKSYSQTVLLKAAPDDIYQNLLKRFEVMEKQAYEEMEREGFERKEVFFQRSADMRYEGQSYEINVPFDEQFLENFNQAYVQRFGVGAQPAAPNVNAMVGAPPAAPNIEVVNLRLKAMASPQKPSFYREKFHGPDPSKAFIDKRNVMISEDFEDVPIYNRDLLRHGNLIKGPAIIVEYSATTLIPNGFICRVDEYGNLVIKPKRSAVSFQQKS